MPDAHEAPWPGVCKWWNQQAYVSVNLASNVAGLDLTLPVDLKPTKLGAYAWLANRLDHRGKRRILVVDVI
jgi:hypothetical protein